MKKGVKIALIVLLIIILLITAVFGIGYGYVHSKLNKMQHVETNPEDIAVTEGVEQQLEGYRNIAILGIDSREDNYDKGNRSDCIIIASINNKTKEVKLASVYRDTYLEITGRDLDKVTHAYSYGGPTLTLSTLNTNLDIDIKEFVTVNFEAVEEIVNSIGGIDLQVTAEEVKYMNQYIDELNKVTSNKADKITTAGKLHLNGTQALAYGRIRYTAGGDYKRAERMRTVLMAVVEKAKTLNIGELNKLADEILPKVYTNINTNELISLIPQMISYKITDSIGWPYKTQGKTINGVWYGPPITLESNVKQLHQELFGEDNYVPSDTVKRISNNIIKKTGYQ